MALGSAQEEQPTRTDPRWSRIRRGHRRLGDEGDELCGRHSLSRPGTSGAKILQEIGEKGGRTAYQPSHCTPSAMSAFRLVYARNGSKGPWRAAHVRSMD